MGSSHDEPCHFISTKHSGLMGFIKYTYVLTEVLTWRGYMGYNPPVSPEITVIVFYG